MNNKVKEKLQNGKKVIGTFFETGSSIAVESLGIAGLDFFIIDTEHGPFDVESSLEFIRAAELRDITPFVRIKDHSRSSVLKMLDIGAKALIIPFINTVDDVRKIVEYGKYYPAGSRGFFYGRTSSYGYDSSVKDINTFFKEYNSSSMLIPQCETVGCLENIEKIVNTEGVDGIFVGPYDLSIGMGIPAQFENPDFTEAVDRILGACIKAGKPAFIFSGNTETAAGYLEKGFSGVAVGTDNTVYINAFRSIIRELEKKKDLNMN